MELPEKFNTWIELAKECIELQKKHPEAEQIIFRNEFAPGKFTQSEFNVNAVKAKALDEILNETNFTEQSVNELMKIMMKQVNQDQLNLPEKIEFREMSNLLFLLAEKPNGQ